MTKIIIAQRHFENIAGIKSLIEKEVPEILTRTSFRTHVKDAFDALEKNSKSVIITGMVFEEDSRGGIILAQSAKLKNNDVKVFMYSTMPENHPSLDGFISKEWGTCGSGEYGNLIEFLKKLD